MKKKMSIEGMMCGHCQARVQKTLEELPGVVSCTVSHETGTALVEHDASLTDGALQAAVEAQGYTVTGIENA